MYKIIFATGNQGKMREIRAILQDTEAEILSMKEAGVFIDIVEDGTTFAENAMIKAKAVAQVLAQKKELGADCVVLADDSGLEIDCLGGEPGVYSARYLGEETPFTVKSQDFLRRLAGVADKERTARFVCAIAAVWHGQVCLCHRGSMA